MRCLNLSMVAKKVPVHTAMFAVYPVLALYLTNIHLVTFQEVYRALLFSLCASFASLLVLRFLLRSWEKAGFAITVNLVLFFSYGHILTWVLEKQMDGIFNIPPQVTLALWVATWLLGIIAAFRLKKQLEPLTVILNVVSLVLVTFSVFQVLTAYVSQDNLPQLQVSDPDEISENVLLASRQTNRPDIYYIILDGYGREDILQEVIHYDNGEMVDFLEDKGFYVAKKSTANYSNTTPSLTSSLNMGYLNSDSTVIDPSSMNYHPLRKLLDENRASEFLRKLGYKMITLETGFLFTEIKTADQYIVLEGGPNYFESLLLNNSLALFWTNQSSATRYRNRITNSFGAISLLANDPSPKFVFAHILAVHPPFVFSPDGNSPDRTANSVELDTGDKTTRSAEIQGYRDQLIYINQQVKWMVDQILKNSPTEPIIILQGDHGPGVYMNWQSAEDTCYRERMAILNAFYFPGGSSEFLYDEISPVNNLRVVFNTFLGTEFKLYEDQAYFSLWESPYQLTDVTSQQGMCPYLTLKGE